MNYYFVLVRTTDEKDKAILGRLMIMGDDGKIHFQCAALELPWRENRRNISAIPEGTYRIVLEMSPKYGMAWELKGVPNRSEVKIHNGNYYTQIEGCILVGRYHKDINGDGIRDVADSRRTRKKMENFMASAGITETTITITNLNKNL